MVRTTSARPSGGRPAVPAKMTSSILPPRSDLAPCSPITHASASTTLDLPEPLGPTTQVMPGSSCRVVADAKDLKPRRVRLFRCTQRTLPACGPTAGLPRRMEQKGQTTARRSTTERAFSGPAWRPVISGRLHLVRHREQLVLADRGG